MSLTRPRVRQPPDIEWLALAYGLGVVGTAWDWYEHLIGPGTQPPHVLIGLGPFVLMMAAPRSQLMASLMRGMMSSGALLVYVPVVLLAIWSAWRWLSLAAIRWWRLATAL